jgi:dihydropteroate synthase
MRRVVADHSVPVAVAFDRASPVDPDDRHDDVVDDVVAELSERLLLAERAGIDRSRVVVDPGAVRAEVLARLDELHALGTPVLVDHARGSALGDAAGPGTAATAAATALAVQRGADAVRVRDVAPNVAAVRTARAARDSR